MHYIFYLLELISPQQYSGMPLEAPVMRFEEDYRKMDSEVACMAKALYWEGRGESIDGLKFIAQVIENRKGVYGFPDTICGVINHKVGKNYQFSYHYNKSLKIKDTKSFDTMLDISYTMLRRDTKYTNALYFKLCSKESEFFNSLRFVAKKGLHCFYR